MWEEEKFPTKLELWVGRNGDDGNLGGIGAVAPEDAISAGGLVLGVGFEDGIAGMERVFQGLEFVGVEAGVAGIGGQFLQRGVYLFEQSLGGGSLGA